MLRYRYLWENMSYGGHVSWDNILNCINDVAKFLIPGAKKFKKWKFLTGIREFMSHHQDIFFLFLIFNKKFLCSVTSYSQLKRKILYVERRGSEVVGVGGRNISKGSTVATHASGTDTYGRTCLMEDMSHGTTFLWEDMSYRRTFSWENISY